MELREYKFGDLIMSTISGHVFRVITPPISVLDAKVGDVPFIVCTNLVKDTDEVISLDVLQSDLNNKPLFIHLGFQAVNTEVMTALNLWDKYGLMLKDLNAPVNRQSVLY